ncbi:hypothetical protein VRY54_08990 [Actinomyces sp. F1_1611]
MTEPESRPHSEPSADLPFDEAPTTSFPPPPPSDRFAPGADAAPAEPTPEPAAPGVEPTQTAPLPTTPMAEVPPTPGPVFSAAPTAPSAPSPETATPPPPPGGAAYPPAPGAAGGYPPPPGPGGPGYPPPPYAGTYPGPQAPMLEPVRVAAVEGIRISDGFNYAWKMFRQHAGLLIGVALTYFAVMVLLWLLMLALGLGFDRSGFALVMVSFSVVVVAVFAAVVQANILRGVLEILRGQPVTFASFFQFEHVGRVLLAGLIIGLLSGVLAFTFVAPVIVSALSIFSYWLIVDKNYGAWDAIVASATIVWNNIATVVLFMIGSAIAAWVGALFFGIGILLAVPVIIIAQGWLFKTLIGEEIAA